MAIVYLSSIFFCIFIVWLIISYKKVTVIKKKTYKNKLTKEVLSAENRLELLFRKSLHTQLTHAERSELNKIINKTRQ